MFGIDGYGWLKVVSCFAAGTLVTSLIAGSPSRTTATLVTPPKVASKAETTTPALAPAVPSAKPATCAPNSGTVCPDTAANQPSRQVRVIPTTRSQPSRPSSSDAFPRDEDPGDIRVEPSERAAALPVPASPVRSADTTPPGSFAPAAGPAAVAPPNRPANPALSRPEPAQTTASIAPAETPAVAAQASLQPEPSILPPPRPDASAAVLPDVQASAAAPSTSVPLDSTPVAAVPAPTAGIAQAPVVVAPATAPVAAAPAKIAPAQPAAVSSRTKKRLAAAERAERRALAQEARLQAREARRATRDRSQAKFARREAAEARETSRPRNRFYQGPEPGRVVSRVRIYQYPDGRQVTVQLRPRRQDRREMMEYEGYTPRYGWRSSRASVLNWVDNDY